MASLFLGCINHEAKIRGVAFLSIVSVLYILRQESAQRDKSERLLCPTKWQLVRDDRDWSGRKFVYEDVVKKQSCAQNGNKLIGFEIFLFLLVLSLVIPK